MTGIRPADPRALRGPRVEPDVLATRVRRAVGHGIAAAGHATVTVASRFSRSRPIARLRGA